MSGHITRMSRGSSVGSSCEQAEQHLAQHVDLPGRAVAAVHLHRPVVRRRARGPRGGRRWRAGRPGASRAGSSGGGRGPRGGGRPCSSGGQAALQLAHVAAERREQRVADRRWPTVVAPRHRPGEVAAQRPPQRRRWGAAATGARRGGWRAPRAGRARSRGSRVWPKRESRGGRSTRRRRAAGRSPRRAARAAAGRRPARPARATAAAARRGRRRGRRRRRRCRAARRASRRAACGRCAAYDANRPASRRATA